MDDGFGDFFGGLLFVVGQEDCYGNQDLNKFEVIFLIILNSDGSE